MESQGARKDAVATQVCVDGFDQNVTAKVLVKYLEETVGLVRRCRLKTSWTPPDSYPDFGVSSFDTIQIVDKYKKVEPHAFVHFASPEAATFAYELSLHDGLFLNNKPLKVSQGPESPFHMNQRRRTATPFKLPDACLEIGNLITSEDFLVGWRGPSSGVDFYVDPFDSMCRFFFNRKTAFSLKGMSAYAVINCEFKMEFLVGEINEIRQHREMSSIVVLLQMASPPRVYYRTADDDIEASVPSDLLDDEDPWIRTTNVTAGGAFGRCNTYRVSIPPRNGLKLKKAMDYLREQRVQELSPRRSLRIQDEPNDGRPIFDPFSCIHYKGIGFDVMFLLIAIIHKNVFSRYQLSESFFELLRSQPTRVNFVALKHICSYQRPVFDACKRLKLIQEWLVKNPKLLKNQNELSNMVGIRTLIVTPTKLRCLPPEVDLSNRVLRKYEDVADRFLRVTFMDESLQMINANVLQSVSFSQMSQICERVRTIMTDGFNLWGRKYSFLAFSSDQLRDWSAWFFSEDRNIDVKKIRAFMGKFNARNTAKCAARMGQCFSSTYPSVEVPQNVVYHDLPDIARNGYCFSDGIGTITPDLAREVAEKLKLELDMPSAYQIHYAGYKGVVACWPSKGDGIQLSLRHSMNKFRSNHTTLEIRSWTRFKPGSLNRQIVTLLSALKVPDEVFWAMQEKMVFKLNQMLVDSDVAFDVLTSSCAEQGNIAAIMLSAGFRPHSEPHLRGMLMCLQAAQLWGLREKAKIFVPSGRWLMGCLDELGVLEQGQCFIQVSSPALENCFIKHGSRFSETTRNLQVIKGCVVVAKSPFLHPGDISILEAVDAPELHHLYDCLVFPQNGERPHTNGASGNDFDGDLYFVTWEENLIPPSNMSWTFMQYDPVEKQLPHYVTGKLSRLLGRYKVNSEEELVTGHVWSMPKYASRKKRESKERLAHSYAAVRKGFREIFEKLDLDFESLSDEERNLLYEQKASAWYQVTYHPEWVKKSVDLRAQDDEEGTGTLMLSFAWIAADFLARIKIRNQKVGNLDSAKAINSLSKYVADRI